MRLALRDGWFSHATRPVLSGVTLDIPARGQLLLYGPAGGGKTTLLKVLAGLLPLARGELRWAEQNVDWSAKAQLRAGQRQMGMVFQTDALFDSLTVRQNVLFPLLQRGVAEATAALRVDALLDEVGLSHAAHRMPETLSGGMKKRCGIARAVAAQPQVLLADDPFAGLDPQTEQGIAELLLRESAGRTLVVALPDPVEAYASLPRARLAGGRLTP